MPASVGLKPRVDKMRILSCAEELSQGTWVEIWLGEEFHIVTVAIKCYGLQATCHCHFLPSFCPLGPVGQLQVGVNFKIWQTRG